MRDTDGFHVTYWHALAFASEFGVNPWQRPALTDFSRAISLSPTTGCGVDWWMDRPPSQSALNTAALALRGLWTMLGLFAVQLDPWAAIDAWVGGIFRRLDAMLEQYRAGKFVVVTDRPTCAVQAVPLRVAGAGRPAHKHAFLRKSRPCRPEAMALDADMSVLTDTRGPLAKPEMMRLALSRAVTLVVRRADFCEIALHKASLTCSERSGV